MARKILCKLSHERGEQFSVGGKTYTIGMDGLVDVDDEHAARMLQNAAKWADPGAAQTPFKRPVGPPALILADARGNVLSPEETAKAMQAAQEAQEAAQKAKEAADPAPAPADSSKAPEPPAAEEGEPAPSDWPTVSTVTSKYDMLATLEKLQAAGHVEAGGFTPKMNKTDLLEVIERAYDSMAE